MSVEARSWGSAPACAACEGVKAPFDGQAAREIVVVLLPWLSTLLDVTPFLEHTRGRDEDGDNITLINLIPTK
jgi:hypothetical protein